MNRRLLLLAAGLLVLTVAASPLFFAPLWPSGVPAVASAPIDWEQVGRVDVNTADEAMLCTLPGVGPARAKAILEDRSVNGPFADLEQVSRVKGISEKTVRRWQGLAYAGHMTGGEEA